MPTLTIRNLPDAVHSALRVRAAHAGRSMEEEVRQMLEAALQPGPFDEADALAAAEEFRALVRAANGGSLPSGAVEQLLAERRAEVATEAREYAERIFNHRKWGLR